LADSDSEIPEEISSTVDGKPPYFAFFASLRIHGAITDLDTISKTLGLKPTHLHRRGERKGLRSPAFEEDAWHFAPPISEERPLNEHIEVLWKILEPHKDYLLKLKQTLKVDVFCGYRSNHWHTGFEVQPTSLAMFTALQIPFGVSIIII
jgi:hypothetical protein